ncbi:MAG: type II toxin-antitoxin system VapC family toxin [Bacteroidota bacterium]
MKYLIDTHIFIWIFSEPEKIKRKVKAILDDPEVILFVSPITFYEIQLKKILGKLDFEPELDEIIGEEYFEVLNITSEHTIATIDLPLLHRDPFDRILIAQSIVEEITMITGDKEIMMYDFPYVSTR